MKDNRGYFSCVGIDGRIFHYDGQSPDEIFLTDVTRSLSRINRYNGHGSMPWSVAAHSLLVAWILNSTQDRDCVLYALLHDAEEAFIGDVIAPLKRALHPHYHNLIRPIRKATLNAFGLDEELPEIVREADTWASFLEVQYLFGEGVWWQAWKQEIPPPRIGYPVAMPEQITDFAQLPHHQQEKIFRDALMTELSRELAISTDSLNEQLQIVEE